MEIQQFAFLAHLIYDHDGLNTMQNVQVKCYQSHCDWRPFIKQRLRNCDSELN